MSEKTHGKTLAFTVHMPSRCVEIIDELIDAGVYSSRGECIRDIVRSAFREGFHKQLLPEKRNLAKTLKKNYLKHPNEGP